MNGIIAITKKELRTYFYSPLAYVIYGAFLLMMGFVFAKFVHIYQQYSVRQMFGQGQGVTLEKLVVYFYQNMSFMFILAIPVITMRLFAEERRQNTLELLLTAPITSLQLVLGKFISSLIMLTVLLGLTFIYVSFMIVWGNPDLKVILLQYIGLFFAFACFVGLGAFISALCTSQAIAAVISFFAILILYLLPSIAEGMQTNILGVDVGAVLKFLSPLSHFGEIADGVVHIKDIVYFITFTVFMIFITYRVVESHRWR